MLKAALNSNVLVLDAGYQAVNVISARKALTLLYSGRAVAVEQSEQFVRSPGRSWQLPRVIRLFIAIAHRVYRAAKVQLNRRNIFARDNFTCQYCGKTEGPFTIDHVVPRSRRTRVYPKGGPTTWENCVTCCVRCNHRKSNHLPEELDMRLHKKPVEPQWLPPLLFRRFVCDAVHQSWKGYLYLD
ncbi:MAG: HNH endonuclease [bacterium]|nr:HNH endonuclease [bacterium]